MLRPPEVASAYCGALVGCASEGGGPSEEQRRIIGALAIGLFGSTEDAFEPMAPEAAAGAIAAVATFGAIVYLARRST